MGGWAVLDCARDPQIYLALLASGLEFRGRYSGKLPRALEMNAPQLVELLPGHRLTTRLLDEGWGKPWGLFLTTDNPTRQRDHLRRWLKVSDEAGRRYLFRFYDPRVLPAWLKSATTKRFARFFGPIERIVTEGPRSHSLFG